MTAIRPSIETSKKRADSGSKGGHSKQSNSEFASDLLPGKTEANEVANTDFASKQTAYLMNKNSIKDIGIRNKKTLKPKDMNPQESSKDDSPYAENNTRFIPPTLKDKETTLPTKDSTSTPKCLSLLRVEGLDGRQEQDAGMALSGSGMGSTSQEPRADGGEEAAHHDYSAYDQM